MSSLRQIIDPKLIRIIDLILKNPDKLYHLQKISQDAKVPLGTTHRLVGKLVKAGFFSTLTVGKIKLYRLNKSARKDFEVLK